MKDLEIRGAGDLLGGEQSGFMNEIGFDTYQKILNEAIEELKENEFKDLYDEPLEDKVYVKDVTIDTDFELLFPDSYINNIAERLKLYTELNELKTEEELDAFKKKLIDRFGETPLEVTNLLKSVQIKWLACKIGFEKIIMKQGKLVGYFVYDQQSNFYQSGNFTKVLKFVQQNANICKMKEKQTRGGLRLLLTFENIKTINQALEAIKPIMA